MASLQDIRRRIRSVKNTQQVTKAMKMISAVKLRKSQERLMALRPYATKLHEVVGEVVGRFDANHQVPETPLARAFFTPREEKRIRVLIMASDKGLCGGYNANVLKCADIFLKERKDDVVHVDALGKRVVDHARKKGIPVKGEHMQVTFQEFADLARGIAESAAAQYERNEIDAFYLIGNVFKSAMSQTPTVHRIFPMEKADLNQSHTLTSHLLEPDPTSLLERLLPRYIEVELLRGVLEGSASEHASRMTSMDKASSNAQEMIDRLTLNMNKVRQAAITNQIIEVVSGAAS